MDRPCTGSKSVEGFFLFLTNPAILWASKLAKKQASFVHDRIRRGVGLFLIWRHNLLISTRGKKACKMHSLLSWETRDSKGAPNILCHVIIGEYEHLKAKSSPNTAIVLHSVFILWNVWSSWWGQSKTNFATMRTGPFLEHIASKLAWKLHWPLLLRSILFHPRHPDYCSWHIYIIFFKHI